MQAFLIGKLDQCIKNAIEEHLIHGPRHITTRVSRYMATGCSMAYFSPADISFMTMIIQLNQCITDAIEEHLVCGPRRMTTGVSRHMATGCGMAYFSPGDISFMTMFIQYAILRPRCKTFKPIFHVPANLFPSEFRIPNSEFRIPNFENIFEVVNP